MGKRTAKDKKMLDLSGPIEQKIEVFEVKDYDYTDLQQPQDAFENDLQYLLNASPTNGASESDAIIIKDDIPTAFSLVAGSTSKPVGNYKGASSNGFDKASSKTRSKVRVNFNVDDVTSDFHELNFSSSEDEGESKSKENLKTNAKIKSKSKLTKRKSNSTINNHSQNEKNGDDEADKLDVSGAMNFVQGGIHEVSSSFENFDELNENGQSNTLKTPSTSKKLKKKKSNLKTKNDLNKNSDPTVATESGSTSPLKAPTQKKQKPKKRKSKKSLNGAGTSEPNTENDQIVSASIITDKALGIEYIDDGKPIDSKSDNTILVGKNNELITVEELKKKKVIDQEYSLYDSESKLTRKQRTRLRNQESTAFITSAASIQVPEESSPRSIDQASTPISLVTSNIDELGEDEVETPTKRDESLSIPVTPSLKLNSPVLRKSSSISFKPSVPETKENPFAINLRSTKTGRGKITDNLAAVRPVKTIIGLTHKQILNLSLSDVKIKAIISSSLTAKFVANILKFTLKHSHTIFNDFEIRKKFLRLCISVALYESIGFKAINKEFDVNELFGSYPEITLDITGTSITPSTIKAHQNQFDYSVLSCIGHVIVWAYSLQVREGITPTLVEKYDLTLSVSEIRKSIGGDHLWDRLTKNSGNLNSKRWKHVIKFRDAFGFYEDQFMLILRFLNVDETIP